MVQVSAVSCRRAVVCKLTHLQNKVIETFGVDVVESCAKLHRELYQDGEMMPPHDVRIVLEPKPQRRHVKLIPQNPCPIPLQVSIL